MMIIWLPFLFFLRVFTFFQLSGRGKKTGKLSTPSRINILNQNKLYDDGMTFRINFPVRVKKKNVKLSTPSESNVIPQNKLYDDGNDGMDFRNNSPR